jgi:allantoate deiminase
MDVERSFENARRAVERCRTLAKLSEDEGRTTRTFLTPPMREAHGLVRSWMENAGLTVALDAIGNLRGSLPGSHHDAPRLLIGSHLDTVPGAGAFDGVLGIMLGIGLIEALDGQRPAFGIEIVAFSEEEGVRFGVPFLGSRAFTGTMDRSLLQRQDARGITVAQAIRDFGLDPGRLDDARYRSSTFGYVEFHIEQGPVLDSMSLPVGVVEAIAGQTRLEVVFRGKTNHAGTTPMHLRRDALPAASQWIVEVEREASGTAGLVATVGSIAAIPGAANVIPGEVRATLDVRHADDSVRTSAVKHLLDRAQLIAGQRGLELTRQVRLEQSAVACDRGLTDIMARCVEMAGFPIHRMVSGAGHDAMVMASRMPVAMLFIRSPEGISHDSAESVDIEDVASSLRVGWHFLKEVGSALQFPSSAEEGRLRG